jgi:shikimate kinase
MADNRSNLVLIGMPGAGKSTVGVILAKETSRDFVDTDLLIQSSQGRSLQEIVDTDGHMALRAIEEKILVGLHLQNYVIATGGSAVYSDAALEHLKSDGIIIFLHVDLAELESRVTDFDTRGLAKRSGQSFSELYEERYPLYTKYAEIRIDCIGLSQEEICRKIIGKRMAMNKSKANL